MSKKEMNTLHTPRAAIAAAVLVSTLAVAYADGPPEIEFHGRFWRIGQAQEVTAAEWSAMQARPECKALGFSVALSTLSPDPSPAVGRGETTSDLERTKS